MNILCVAPYYKPAYVYGGPVRSNSQLCEALVKLGVKVTVLTTNANGNETLDVPIGRPTNINGVEVIYYPVVQAPPRSFFYSPALAKACYLLVSQFEIAFLDTIFTHAMGPVVASCQQARVPYTVALRGAFVPGNFKQKQWKKKLYLSLLGGAYLNGAAALHCTVPAEVQAVRKLKLQAPTFVVPNGLDTRRFACLPTPGALRRRLNIPEQAHLLLYVGRLHPAKRPDLAVEALSAAQALPGETHLVLAGPDEMQLIPKLTAQALQSGCADQLHFAGLLKGDEILAALADADLLLMPSEPHSENFGMAAVEAMAAGVPVLVSEGVPVGAWAEPAGAGRIASCSVESFSRMTCEMLRHPGGLKEMGKKGQILVHEKFESEKVAQQMLAHFHSIISTGKPLPSM
jgi:glycosyltransferase involved in cell wall biosynthesis